MARTNSIPLPSFIRSRTFVELNQSLPSEVAEVSAFVDQLMAFIAQFRKSDGREVDLEVALTEALLNAVIHGNAENPCMRVYVSTRCCLDGDVSITVRDEGQGFDSSAAPDPTAAGNLMSNHGRGIYLIRALMDEVSFEEGGTVVHMRKKPNAKKGS